MDAQSGPDFLARAVFVLLCEAGGNVSLCYLVMVRVTVVVWVMPPPFAVMVMV
jgi:hypothetical protein